MSRFLITDSFPKPPPEIPADTIVVAPHSRIGRSLGVPTISLQSIAKDLLKRASLGIATPIRAAESLRLAVRETNGNADAAAVAMHNREIIAAMLRSGIDLAKLSEVGSVRAKAAARIASRYVQILIDDNLIDPDAVLSAALQRDLIRPQRVVIYGYFRARQLDARPEEIGFIDRLAGDESIFYLPLSDAPLFAANRAWFKLLVDRGWQIAENEDNVGAISQSEMLAHRFADGNADSSSDSVQAIEYPDIEKEVRGTLARAKAAAIDGISISEIAIVCRDLDLYGPLMISTAREYGLPIEIDYEVPIRDTAFGEFISLIFETLELRSDLETLTGQSYRKGFDYEPTLRLLLHRFGAGLTDVQRANAYLQRPSSFAKWYEITDEVSALVTDGERPTYEWTSWLRRILDRWNVRSADKLTRSAAETSAYDRFFEAVEQHSRERGDETISIAEFASEVTEILANIKTPLHPQHGGIKILLPNVVVGSRFERMFVVGMAEGILPAPSTDSSVIDFCEREHLRDHGIHFENAHEVPRWEALTFYFTLLACTGKLVLSYPHFADSSERLASAYFSRLGITPIRDDKNFVSSLPEYRRAYLRTENGHITDEILSLARCQFEVESHRESDAPPDKYDGVIDVPIRRSSWSATSLTTIGSCPFKWFASDVLKLSAPDEADTELPANIRGTLLHKTLEIATDRSHGAADLRAAMSEVLEEAFAEAESMHQQLTVVANWELRRSEQVQKLRRAIVSDEFIDEGATVLKTEQSFEAELCGLAIKGTIDRIDRLADGRLVAVDYKHSGYVGRIKDADGVLNIEIQLPIYSALALRKLYPDEPIANGRFFHLADPNVTNAKEVELEDVLLKIKSLLEHGHFAVDPDVKHDACEYCRFDIVCRVGPRVELKRVRNIK
jgi:ATP-dependent helicase/DNAse subunit B